MSVSAVMEMFKKNVTKVISLIASAVPTIAAENWDDTINELQVIIYQNQIGILLIFFYFLEYCCKQCHVVNVILWYSSNTTGVGAFPKVLWSAHSYKY